MRAAARRRARAEGTVTVMAADGPREPARDLYQLLGVAGDASRAASWDEEDVRLALLAELVLRRHGRGRPW